MYIIMFFCMYIIMFYAFNFLSSYAKSVGAKHFHTSAKLNKGIDELFLDLTKCEHLCFFLILFASATFNFLFIIDLGFF